MRPVVVALAALSMAGCLGTQGSYADEPTGLDSAPVETSSGDDGGVDGSPTDTSTGSDTGAGTDTSTETSTSSDTGVDDTAPPTDSTPPPDTTPVDTGDTGCDESKCGALPTGAKRIAIVDRTVACPAGWTSTDVVDGSGADACACSCAVGVKPTCAGTGSISTGYGSTSACSSTGGTVYSPAADVCGSFGGSVSIFDYFLGKPLGPLGGTCTPSLKTDKPAATRTRRLCEPKAGMCAGPLCEGTPFLECIELTAAGSCPAPFTRPRTLGSDFIVSCPTCTCGVNASCTGTLTFYDKGGCTGASVAVTVDGSCVAVPGGAKGGLETFKYKPDPVVASCTSSYASAPGTKTYITPRQLCCR